MTGLQYAHGIEGLGASFITGSSYGDLPASLQRFSSYLGAKPWFIGDYLTVADFVMYEYLTAATQYHKAHAMSTNGSVEEHCLASTPNLLAFATKFESLPAIAAYLTSDRFVEVQAFNNQHAKFR